jgi:hypothetical protein
MGIMDLTGSLWRVKNSSNSLVILPKPMRYCDFLQGLYTSPQTLCNNCFLSKGDVIIVSSSQLFSPALAGLPSRYDKFQTWLKVALPAEGYLNSVYFHKDSLWIERIG